MNRSRKSDSHAQGVSPKAHCLPHPKIFEACLDRRAGAKEYRHRVNPDLRQKTTKEKTTKEKITKEKPTKEEENETYSLK